MEDFTGLEDIANIDVMEPETIAVPEVVISQPEIKKPDPESVPTPKPHYEENFSLEDIYQMKRKFLNKITNLKRQGHEPAIELTIDNSLETIKEQYKFMEIQAEMDDAIEMYKKGIIAICSGIETMDSVLKLKLNLGGWGSSIQTDIENRNYNKILQELYLLYRNSLKIHPMIQLMGAIIFSAVMFSVSKNFTDNLFNDSEERQDPIYSRIPSPQEPDLKQKMKYDSDDSSSSNSDSDSLSSLVSNLSTMTPVKTQRRKKTVKKSISINDIS